MGRSGSGSGYWQEIAGHWVLLPPRPQGIIHFLGGAFAGTTPHVSYRWLLERLAWQNFGVIATPFTVGLDHQRLATDIHRRLLRVWASLGVSERLPIYGLGHSMGCKLHLLLGSLWPAPRAANLFMAYNNSPLRGAIPGLANLQNAPLLDQLPLEFTPSPGATLELVRRDYGVARNLLIRFAEDTLDETPALAETLRRRFPQLLRVVNLPGTHVTPLGLEVNWSAGRTFTPMDAVGQWMKQWAYQHLYALETTLLQELAVG